MHYVGVDLAWGHRSPTGLAVLDDAGTLVHVSAARTDEEILAVLRPWTAGPVVVAIDAPLVVTNPTGNRVCEAELNRDFARFDAGAHPSNTGKPEFAGTPRGALLAADLGLDLDPDSTAARRAVEVYPHPATVALFRLGRTLKYKQKQGRSVAALRAELLRLTTLLEQLGTAEPSMALAGNPDWRALVEAVEVAERKSDLRRVEDQVDAVVCAYVARFAHLRPDATTTYGDLATGYVVTPTLPAGHVPTVRVPRGREAPTSEGAGEGDAHRTEAAAPGSGVVTDPATAEPVRRAVRTYAERHPALQEATEGFVGLVTTLLDDAGINYLSVTGRAKSVASFAAKAERRVDGVRLYPDPLTGITDQVGVRVVTYLHSDVAAVADVFADQLRILDDRDLGEETAREGRFGYASRHVLVALDPERPTPAATGRMRELTASVQVRTVLQHAWAEFEHDIRYKGTIPAEHAPDLDRRFTLAAGLLELADREFSAIRDRLQESMTGQHPEPDAVDPRISAQELATFLAGQYADAGWSRTDHYAWISGLLLELAIVSLDELAALLASVDSTAIHARMGYRYPAGAVRRLDDALLAVFGERYVELHGNAHRVPLLRTRLERLRTPPEA
ncbi:DUF429 domain-containing protein [Nocardioides donggukensis]|uniref:DUF429 domain-containing protein n=1 Tax=Nocardioides donggukensis TaxID=2774019 RepID=A0A927Q1V4_9ACTN|nr:DUF429 domain-containing protein [Nocardioides donggukensis]MBD8870557.1 DUF429 domain-containing protein [Nocardioides donggukensis]